MGARLLSQSYQYPNLSEGADRVDGQLRGDREYPFSSVTKSGGVWRKVPESGARSVPPARTGDKPFKGGVWLPMWQGNINSHKRNPLTPYPISLMVYVDAKHHVYLLTLSPRGMHLSVYKSMY